MIGVEPAVASIGTLTNLVSLIAAYRSESRAATDDELQDFQLWLAQNHHNKQLALLERSAAAMTGIRLLLKQDRESLNQKLDAIDQILAGLVSRIDGFGELAAAIRPGVEISEQAATIIQGVYEKNGGVFMLHDSMAGKSIILLDGDGDHLDIAEPRFIEDDLETLCECGLLRPDFNGNGDRLFRLTRLAEKFVS